MYKSDPLKNKFFGICMPMAYYFCLLPDVLDFKSSFNRMMYIHYAKLIYGFAIFINISQMIKLYQIVTDEVLIVDEVIKNLNLTLYFSNIIIKGLFLKGKLSGKIFTKVFHFEDSIYSTGDPTVQTTYETSLIPVKTTTHCCAIAVALLVISYIPAPFFRDPYYITKGNETLVIYQMPLSEWTPFDNGYYWAPFVYTSGCGAYMAYMFATTDMICYSFILFGVSQLEVLLHYINNFGRYASEYSETHRISLDDSYRKMQKENVKMHQEIISYVIQLNDTLRNIMLIDFVPSSFQLAAMIYQIMKNLSVIQVLLVGQFIISQLTRLFMYCNVSNMLTQKGLAIGDAWYNLDWTEFPEDVRKNIVLCIMRPQKPLYISLGKFHDISLLTFITIIRGTYSYTILLTTI